MTELGLANEIGGGKVRWRSIQENQKASLVTTTGPNVVAMSLSADSEWLSYGRRNSGVFVLKLKGGSGSEIALPNPNSLISSNVNALLIHKVSNSKSMMYRVVAGDQQGTLVYWLLKYEHSTISTPQLIAKDLGCITAVTNQMEDLFVASKDGVKVIKLDSASGGVL